VARGTFINFIGYVVGFLQPLFLLVVTRMLGADRLGAYILATNYAALLLRLGVLGLDKGMLRHLPMARAADTPERAQAEVLGTALRWILALSVLTAAALYAAADWVVAADGSPSAGDAAEWIRLIVFAVPGEALLVFFLFALRGKNNMWAFVICRNFLSPLLLFVITVPGIWLGASAKIVVVAYLAAQYLSAAAAYAIYRRYFPGFGLSRILRAGWDRALVVFSFPQGLTEFLNLLIARADILMIAWFFHDEPELVAIYGVASLLAGLVKKVRQGFDTSLAPVLSGLIARDERDALEHTYRQVARWIYALWIPLSGVLCFGAALILAAYGPRYVPYWGVVPVLVVGKWVNAAAGPTQTALLMAGRSGLELLNNVVVLVINVGLNVLLIPRYGIYGAAVATAVAITTFNVIRVVQVWRTLRIFPRVLDLGRITLAGGFAVAAGALALWLLPASLWRFGVAVTLFGVTYPLALLAVGLGDDFRAVRRAFRGKRQLAERRGQPTP
jgi:O-antigen/teichoic acid export membrane protein